MTGRRAACVLLLAAGAAPHEKRSETRKLPCPISVPFHVLAKRFQSRRTGAVRTRQGARARRGVDGLHSCCCCCVGRPKGFHTGRHTRLCAERLDQARLLSYAPARHGYRSHAWSPMTHFADDRAKRRLLLHVPHVPPPIVPPPRSRPAGNTCKCGTSRHRHGGSHMRTRVLQPSFIVPASTTINRLQLSRCIVMLPVGPTPSRAWRQGEPPHRADDQGEIKPRLVSAALHRSFALLALRSRACP